MICTRGGKCTWPSKRFFIYLQGDFRSMINKHVFVISVIIFAIMTRFLPHPPNFTPLGAIALLSSKGLSDRWIVFVIPVISLFISDLIIGLHATIPFVYASFVLITLLGMTVKNINVGTILLSSVIFFIVSNFGVWLLYYPQTLEGLIQCYALAIPFFFNTVLGDLIFSALLIFPFYLLHKRELFKV